MQCPKCQSALREGVKFCEDCGFRITLDCSSCGAEILPGKNFCGSCGTPAIEQVNNRFISPETYTPKYLAERILTSKAAIEGERKLVTVLFADVKGSMELLADRDPEEARILLDAVLDRMMDAVHRYDGTVNQVMGDGIMALFGAPLALEDHALRACYAAIAMQGSIQEYREQVRRSYGVDVQIRVGLNSGEVVVRAIGSDLRMDYSAIGQTTHLAARMEQLASPGSIYMMSETFHLAEGFVQVQSLGPVPVKGLQEPVEVFELTGVAPVTTRFHTVAASGLTRLVERGDEFDILRGVIYRAGNGYGQILAVMGEAGIGKSRLFWEFTRSHRTKEWKVIECGSVSYGKTTAYKPVIDLLKAYFAIEDTDDHNEIREKVTGNVRTLDDSLASAIPPILSLLEVPVEDETWKALDPPERRQRTIDGIKGMMLRETKIQPLCLVLEDLHWIDSETQALLDSLVESLSGARILLLVNYRPGYEHGWTNKAYYTGLRLAPLSSKGSEELLKDILGENETLGSLKKLFVERTEGNPFFLEECIQTLIESGALVGNLGAYELVEEISEIHVPSTVQAVLAARMDRLPPEEKHLLQTASVVGMHVPFPLLYAVAEMSEVELQKCLSSLQASEFLYEINFFPEREFNFKHALTHEVAYESLLTSRRQALHVATGRTLESLYVGRLEEVYDHLAHHYSKTGESEKAVEYLKLLAKKTAGMHAHAEALKSLQEALVHADLLPPEERDYVVMDLVIRQAESFHFMGKRQDIIDLLLQHKNSLEQLQDSSLAGRYYFWLGWAHTWLGHRAEAAQSLDRSLQEAQRSGDEGIMGRTHHALAVECRYSGRPLDEAVAHSREAVSHLERADDQFWLSQALLGLSYSFYCVGEFCSAIEVAASLKALGEPMGNRRARANAAMMTGLSHATRGDWAVGVEALQRALELSPDDFETAWILACLGKANLEAGDVSRAVPVLEQAVELGDRVRSRQFQAWFRTLLGEAYLSGKRIEEARNLILEALEISMDTKYMLGVGLAESALGRIAQVEGSVEEAEGQFVKALQTFISLGARFEIGRTYLDLAILARSRGDQKAAATHIQEARSLFKDLKIPKYVERVEQMTKDVDAH